MERVGWVEHRDGKQSPMDCFLPACGLPPTGSGLPMENYEQNGPWLVKEVLEATNPALDALRHVWTCLGSSPGPTWAAAEYCL